MKRRKRPIPLTMEARIRQARQDVLRGHAKARRVSRSPSPPVLNRLVVLVFGLFGVMLLASASGYALPWTLSSLLMMFLFKIGPLCILFLYLAWFSKANREQDVAGNSQRYQDALIFLTDTHDLRAIGPLAEAFWLKGAPSSVAGALTRLLRVQAQMRVSVSLDDRQRNCLYRILALTVPHETELQIAVLEFLETFGDVRALAAVTRMAEHVACPPRLQTAACRCLLALQAEQAERTGRQTLLRGTLAPPFPSAELLHPALTPPEPQPEQLLRASNQD